MAAANAVVICDNEGRILKVNPAFTTFTGYSAKEAIGQSTSLLRSGKHPDSFYDTMWKTISGGDVWHGEIVNKRKDGSLYTEDMTITPIFCESGEIKNYIAIKQDVTEKKLLKELYLRSQRIESMGTIAGGVAHDLNNALSPIIMSADLLLAQHQGEDEAKAETYQMIKDGAKRGADIVRQLLGFARGDGDELIEIQVRHLLKDQIKIFRSTFPKNITIEADLDASLNTVLGNSTKLIQVFTNLMINARDAMPEGGELLVQASNQTLDPSFVKENSMPLEGEVVRIRIRDTGVGMKKELQEKIFDPFFTTKERGKGTGLGLPSVLTIIHEHHGVLHLDSEENKGTTFDVYLPANLTSHSVEADPVSHSAARGNGEVILVVDDEKSIGFMLKSILESLGYVVFYVNGGKEALEWVDNNPHRADGLILDLMMPEVDGIEVFQILKKKNHLPPTLFMSGMISDGEGDNYGGEEGVHFISKPFAVREIAERLQVVLRQEDV